MVIALLIQQIKIIVVNGYRMNSRKSTKKQKYQHALQTLRSENDELMKLKISKKKIQLNSRFDKKDIHNFLNSLLQGDIIQEDLFNEFWSYYFQKSATMNDVVNAYNNTLIMLVDKIIRNNNRMNELSRERERLKQSHYFKGINEVNLQLDTVGNQIRQYEYDLQELSKPFQFNFNNIIEFYKLESIKNIKTNLESPKDTESLEGRGEEMTQIAKKIMQFAQKVQQDKNEEQQQQENVQLTEQQKYYRIIVYLSLIIFTLQLSMSFNKDNFLGSIVMLYFLGNTLLEDYLLRKDVMNKIMQKVDINFAEDKISLRDVYSLGEVVNHQSNKEIPHNFEIYANSSILIVGVSLLWDILWVLLYHSAYSDCESNPYITKTISFGFWRYNRYILYSSVFNIIGKAAILTILTQISNISVQRVFSKHNGYLVSLRFMDVNEIITSYSMIK